MYGYDDNDIYAPRSQMVGAFPSDVHQYGVRMGASGMGDAGGDVSNEAAYQEMLRMLEEEHRKQQQQKQRGGGIISGLLGGGSSGGGGGGYGSFTGGGLGMA